MLDTTIQVKTDQFDGPLALLLLLIEKEEMNVRELDLTKITRQYLEYLAQMRDLNFDIAGDYLYLASTLVLLKSKNCITEEEQNQLSSEFGLEGLHITSHSELVRRLEELQHYQKMSKQLWDLPKKGYDIFTKPKIDRKAIINSILTPMDLNAMTMAMVDLMFRQRRKYAVVKRDRLSIKEKLVFLKSHLKVESQSTLDELVAAHGAESTDNTVITFISLLELARLKRIELFQNDDRSTIYVHVVKSLDDFDVEQANGFEEEGVKPSTPDTESGETAQATEAAAPQAEEKLFIEDIAEVQESTQEEVALEIPDELQNTNLH